MYKRVVLQVEGNRAPMAKGLLSHKASSGSSKKSKHLSDDNMQVENSSLSLSLYFLNFIYFSTLQFAISLSLVSYLITALSSRTIQI